VLIVLWLIPALLVGRLAERKGRSFVAYLVVSLIIGWVIPLIVAILVPRHTHMGDATDAKGGDVEDLQDAHGDEARRAAAPAYLDV
jgi:hypothetical protein